LKWALCIAALPVALHFAVLGATRMHPPAIDAHVDDAAQASDDPTRRELGASYARRRGAILEVRLSGDAVESGHAHVKLLYDEQVAIEREMHDQFAHYVPWSTARLLIVDMARLKFRNLDESLSADHRLEIAAQARAFDPDPFTSLMGTYQRFVFLHSLYDIMLAFERSPLVGCSSVVLSGELTADGHTLLARNFDFEGPPVLDQRKAVFLMLERGRIPYASISWPGFVGSASGMNVEGVAIVIHGARAGEPRAEGEPVAQTVRELLGGARSTTEALAMLSGRDPMVPHMLLVADGSGDAAVVERVPGRAPHVRRRRAAALPLTNHFEGPAANDPKNQAVIASTSTEKRRTRLDEILANIPADATVERAVGILRDKHGTGDVELPLGHRSAIDALIATHSVIMDATARVLWVSEGPHAAGRYLRFDLRELLDPAYVPHGPATVEAVPADDILADGRYDAWVKAGAAHQGAE
jgi:hypothetical protein